MSLVLIKLRYLNKYKIIYMDEFVDRLLRDEIVFGITLPYLPKRYLLEEQGVLQQRQSPLLEDASIEKLRQENQQKEDQKEPEADNSENNKSQHSNDQEMQSDNSSSHSKLKKRRERSSSSDSSHAPNKNN